MKKTSKIISFLLVAIMVLSVFTVSASAVATPLTAGNTKEKAVNIPSYGREYVSELSKEGETDWFKFTTLSKDAYYSIALENYNILEGWNDTQWLSLRLYDVNMKELTNIYSTSSLSIKLQKDTTYYFRVAMNYNYTESVGNYEICVDYKFDSVSNDMGNATAIDINQTYNCSLDGTGDVDWYKFIAPKDGVYKLDFINQSISTGWNETQWIHVYLIDKYKKEIVHNYGSLAEATLEKGATYYIKVCMGVNLPEATGNYSIEVSNDSVSNTKKLTGISVTALPEKTIYKRGESFDKTGLVIRADFSDGFYENIKNYTLKGFESETTGSKTVTVSYTLEGITKTCSFKVEVVDGTSSDAPNDSEGGFSNIFEVILFIPMLLVDLIVGFFSLFF